MTADNEFDAVVEKVTRRYKGLTPKQTAVVLKERYIQRRDAIARFTDRVTKNQGWVDAAEVDALRQAGVGEEEIKALIAEYGAK